MDASKMMWMDKRLVDLSREELIDAVLILQAQFEASSANFFKLADLNRRLLVARRTA